MRGSANADQIIVGADMRKRVLKHEGEEVLTLTLRTPHLPEDTPALRRIGRYYARVAALWQARWEGTLYGRACAELAALRERSLPFRPWEAVGDFTLTYQENGLLSLHRDVSEYTGGAHGSTVRCGDTWDLRRGVPRTLPSFFPPRSSWRREALSAVHSEIERRLATGEHLFSRGWERSLRREFDPNRFYLTAEGVTLFYPLYTLAPYAEGIPTFSVVKWSPT